MRIFLSILKKFTFDIFSRYTHERVWGVKKKLKSQNDLWIFFASFKGLWRVFRGKFVGKVLSLLGWFWGKRDTTWGLWRKNYWKKYWKVFKRIKIKNFWVSKNFPIKTHKSQFQLKIFSRKFFFIPLLLINWNSLKHTLLDLNID